MPFTCAILVTVLSYTWVLEPRLPHSFVAAPIGIVLALGLWRGVSVREWGFAPDAIGPGLLAAAAFTVPLVVAFLAWGALAGTLNDGRDFGRSLAALVVWGGAQQWMLQTIVLREAQQATSRRAAGIVLASGLFAALHLPNPFLTVVTAVGALGWCTIYDRYPNIIPLALSHAVGTLAVLYAFDDAVTGRLRVGLAYLSGG